MKTRLFHVMAVMVFVLLIPTGLWAQEAATAVKSKDKTAVAESNESFKETLKKAEAGDPNAQMKIGIMLHDGIGVPQDYNEAFKWFTKAAEQGNADGQFCVGLMFDKGQGVSQDYKEAAKWYTKAAEQGSADGQLYLGLLFDEGQGVPQDYKEAAKWYTKAAEQGNAEAQYFLGAKFDCGEGVPHDYNDAVKWYTKAAEQGFARRNATLVTYSNGVREYRKITKRRLNGIQRPPNRVMLYHNVFSAKCSTKVKVSHRITKRR